MVKRFKKGEEPIGKDGWVRGRLDTPWNKGKKMSEEARKKLSEQIEKVKDSNKIEAKSSLKISKNKRNFF